MKLHLSGRQIALIVSAFAVVFLAVAALGEPTPGEVLKSFVLGSVGRASAWRDTLRETTPLLLAGTAVYIALRAGLFNIGAEGQLLVGAASCAAVALQVPGPLGLCLGTLAGMAAGAAWAWPAGAIRAYLGGHEVISTIMLNSIALFFTAWLVAGPMQDPGQGSPTTRSLPPDDRLPTILTVGSFQLNIAFLLSLALVAALAFWMRKTVAGFELKATGANPSAAATAGIDVKRTMALAMAVSGAVAGLAGAVLVTAFEGRFYANFSPGYGFDALGVALLAGAGPWGLVPGALVFGILASGTAELAIEGVPRGLSGILLGLLIIVFAAVRFRRKPTHD